MRGIVFEDVQRVELVTATHPRVQSFLRWRDQHISRTLEVKFQERAQERAQLAHLLGAPITALLTEQALVEQYRRHVYTHRALPTLPAPTCRECRHCRDDLYTPGALVCWHGWTQGRPRPLTSLTPCTAFVDSRQAAPAASWYGLRQELRAFLASYGIHYNAWCELAKSLKRKGGFTDTQTESRLV